jgi:ribonuclease HII
VRRSRISWKYEKLFLAEGKRLVAGIDEAGRGPLAGPVVAAAVLLPLENTLPKNCFGLNDSKQLQESEREELFKLIHKQALAIGVGIRSPKEIDTVNILRATMQAMTDAVIELESAIRPEILLVDGNYFRTTLKYPFKTIIDGDALCPSIAAASIIAKVTRDRIMKAYHTAYPEYNFSRNKGYATKEHRDAIVKFGYCDIHRRSFKLKSLQEEMFA